jgi:hypothetical protein
MQELIGDSKKGVVVNQSDKEFVNTLAKICGKLRPKMCLEAVAGEMTGLMLQFLGFGSILIQYGILSEKKIRGINAISMTGKD